MANIRYFADLADGSTLTFDCVNYHSKNDIRAYDREGQREVQITRKVEMKSFPSRHNCDDRCMYAQGKTMKCECACGGKNHGKGRVTIMCEAA